MIKPTFLSGIAMLLLAPGPSLAATSSPPKASRSQKASTTYMCVCCGRAKTITPKRVTKLGRPDRRWDPFSRRELEEVDTVIREARSRLSIRQQAPVAKAMMSAAGGAPQASAIPSFPESKVSPAAATVIEQRGWMLGHGPWHAIHRWGDLSREEQDLLIRTGWNPPRNQAGKIDRQEGQPKNGIKFGGMHGAMFAQLTQALGSKAGDVAGWTRSDWNQLKPNLSPADQRVIDMMMELVEAQPAPGQTRPDTQIGRLFGSRSTGLDDFANWIQTQRSGSNLSWMPPDVRRLAGTHNRVHVALSDPQSPIDMGNPEVNLGNRLFWGWHGLIDRALNTYVKTYATPAEKAEYSRVMQEELRLMDPASHQGSKLRSATAALQSLSAEDKQILASILKKASPIATRADLPPP